MKRQIKLTSQENQQLHAAELHSLKPSATEFASVEAMLRHDAMHTPVPPTIAHRLQESIGQTQPPAQSWWRRFFG